MSELKKLVIKENEWLRGEGTDNDKSYLLRPSDGKKCCLGFLGNACGLSDELLIDRKSPADLPRGFGDKEWPSNLINNGNETSLCESIININDSSNLTDEQRKLQLEPRFKELGYKLVFVP